MCSMDCPFGILNAVDDLCFDLYLSGFELSGPHTSSRTLGTLDSGSHAYIGVERMSSFLSEESSPETKRVVVDKIQANASINSTENSGDHIACVH